MNVGRIVLVVAKDSSKASRSGSNRFRNLSGDLLAGVSVALVLIPQSLAYAELAGLDAVVGLLAAGLPLVVAAPIASSPYLQTGPTALLSLLTFGILSVLYEPGTFGYASAAAYLALLVGLIRVVMGLARLGAVAYFMSQPVMQGFTSAAAMLIMLSQLPAALGVSSTAANPAGGFVDALAQPGPWDLASMVFSAGTVLIVLGAQRISPPLPGALFAVVLGVLGSNLFGFDGPVVGSIESVLSGQLSLVRPWQDTPDLLLGAVAIAIVGFAEPASIARSYSTGKSWDPDRELVSQGAANVASGVLGAFPVGGSFSRSALNRAAGAKTRWSGLFTGLTVLVSLPLVGLLAPLPKAVLAGVVLSAVYRLVRPRSLLRLWRYARLQAVVAFTTFGLTLVLAPRMDVAVLIGIALAIAVHLYREMDLDIESSVDGDVLILKLSGVLWFGSTHLLEDYSKGLFPPEPQVKRFRIDGTALGRVDLTGSLELDAILSEAQEHGLEVEVVGLRAHMKRVLERIRRD